MYYWTDARQHGIYLFYIITKSPFCFKIFQHNSKAGLLRPRPRLCPAFAHLGEDEKKAIWRDLLSIQNEAISLASVRSKELWLVEENHAIVKPDSSVASREMKTYSEIRIELRNLQILKKMLGKASQFFVIGAALWAEELGRCLENCRSWKIPSENLWLRST